MIKGEALRLAADMYGKVVDYALQLISNSGLGLLSNNALRLVCNAPVYTSGEYFAKKETNMFGVLFDL